jgi:hypothetical protein
LIVSVRSVCDSPVSYEVGLGLSGVHMPVARWLLETGTTPAAASGTLK